MVGYPVTRLRRLRGNMVLRDLVRETQLTVNDLIYPLFVVHGTGVKTEVTAMPGVCRLSVDNLLREVAEAVELGVKAVLLFGIPAVKDEQASEAWAADGIIPVAVRALKERFPELLVITDVCLCAYTDHGHCGPFRNGKILNDPALEYLARTALAHARAGADLVAPSDMMDGRVGAIRARLDAAGFEHLPVMAYAAKYASAFYGPFREAADSAPECGDRKTYQMDPANGAEALREVALDIQEGADIVMVKPALAYLDVIWRVKERFGYPVAAYQVSGEYSMIKAAAAQGWLDAKMAVLESLTGIKRAGADLILTYFAKEAAGWLS
jgi:porphobilinogen synthase